MAFAKKHIDVSFELASGQFGGGGNNATVKGLRVLAMIHKPGGAAMGQLECAIYGLPLSAMNQLTTLGTQSTLFGKNTIKLKAYEDGQQAAMVYSGTITTAFADIRQPDACLRVSALAGLFEALKPTEATSQKGSTDVSQTMKQIADKAGLQFEDAGVNTKVMNPYLSGSPRQQALLLAKAAGIEWIIDNDTLAIWKPNQPRQSQAGTISPETGMVGYPRYNQAGLEVTTLFDPAITFGGTVTVKSDLTPACGTWIVTDMIYNLETEVPNGKWFCTLTVTRPLGQGGGGGDVP